MSKKALKILAVLFCVVISVATIALTVKVSKLDKPKELSVTDYTVGGLDDSGKEAIDEHSLRSEMYTADKFNKIEIADDADVTYKLFYYIEGKEFLVTTDEMSEDMTEIPKEHPELGVEIEYFRIVITLKDSSKKINFLNKRNYVKQVTVTINR